MEKCLRSASNREKQTLTEEKMKTASIGLIEHVHLFSYGIAIHLELSILIVP